jgi:hypothetical protein
MEATVELKRDDYSVLELHLTEAQAPARNRRGIGIGDISVLPIRRGWRDVVSKLSTGLRGAASPVKPVS